MVLITQFVPYAAAELILLYLLWLHAIGTYISLGILNMVAVSVFGLKVTSINVSPLNAALGFNPF